MGRLIIEGIILWIIFQVLRAVFRPHRPDFYRPMPPTSDPNASQMMIQCYHCKDYFPADRALYARGRTYCSDEHRRADAAA